MRSCVFAAVLCASLFAAASATAAGSAAVAPAAPPAPAASDSDAAAKHAKLTECLKEAKTRKLIGTEKTAFLKDCTAKR